MSQTRTEGAPLAGAFPDNRILLALAGLALVAALPYLRAISIPLISDDYLQIDLGRHYGPVSGWPDLARDALYRCRATSIVLTHWTERIFGISTLVFSLESILLHILNTWLVFAAGAWRRIGYRVSLCAAVFFGLYEGHQEAVIWYSALPELLLFLFGLSCVLLWIRWLERGGAWLLAGVWACYLLALLSKEPAVILVPLVAAAGWAERQPRRTLANVLPMALVALVYTLGIFAGQSDHLHFHDGTFSLRAPFWVTWTNSLGRLFFVWGLVSAIALVAWKEVHRWWPMLSVAIVWTGLTLLPFSFLTYMPRIPSRHTYLASAGLALVVAAAFLSLRERMGGSKRWIPAAVVLVMVLHQCGYVWTRKQAQFAERAEPTEEIIRFARSARGPIHVHCFPYGYGIASLAVQIGAGKPAESVVPDSDAEPGTPYLFCLGDRRHRSLMRLGPNGELSSVHQ